MVLISLRFYGAVKNLAGFVQNKVLKYMVFVVFGVQQLWARYYQQLLAIRIYEQEAEALIL